MDFIPALLGSASTLVLFCVLGGSLYKILQISTDLREVKATLQQLKRDLQTSVPSIPQLPQNPGAEAPLISPEDLVRAVHAQGYESIARDPDPISPRS